MEYEFHFRTDEGVVIVEAHGMASLDGFSRMDTELVLHEEWQPGMGVLRDLDMRPLSSADTRASSDWVRGLADQFGGARFAIVMEGDVGFGIARMFEMLTTDGTGLEISAFRSIEEAEDWLGQ